MEDGTTFVPMMIAEPNRDVFEQLVQRIESDVDKDGWDQPNRLFRIDTHPAPIAGMAALHVSEFPWPERDARAHPMEVLPRAARSVLTLPAEDLELDTFVGLALSFESWALPHTDDEATRAEMEAAYARREAHQHPAAVEIRMVLLYAPATKIAAYRQRGEAPKVAEIEGDPDGAGTALGVLLGAYAVRIEQAKAGQS